MFPSIDWNLFTLELVISGILIGLVVLDIFLPKTTKEDWIGNLSILGILVSLCVWISQSHGGITFGGTFVMDSLAWFFKGFFLLTMVFVFAMTKEFFKSLPSRKNEFYLLLWLALLGMNFVASAADFLVLFIALETLTISLYVMTAYLKSDKHSIEAGMKYLILGALTSGFFLFGISLLYGVTRSTHFDVIQQYALTHPMEPMVLLALVLIFTAIGFKIAAVPFQLWVPDVYQGAPTPVTALLSVGSKAAGFVIFIRLFFGIFAAWHVQWSYVLAILAAITMCYGNLGALFQTNIKRLFGYSSIGHAGYLLMGAATGSLLGVSAMNYYLLGYLFTNLAAFCVIVLFFIVQKSDDIEDYTGLSKRSPFLACTLLLALVSLAGIPPLAGFFGKFSLLMATIQSGLIWLAVIAGVNIVISVYYYLRVAQRLYADSSKAVSPITVSFPMKVVIGFAIIGIIAMGIFQGPFLDAAIAAAQGMIFHP